MPRNTQRENEKAARKFRTYLQESGENPEFEEHEASSLNKLLQQFYFRSRKESGQFYKTSSLENFRHILHRYLSLHGKHNFDIIKNADFATSNEYFKAAMRGLKAKGLETTDQHAVIEQADLAKIYEHLTNTDAAEALLKKVQFDICFISFVEELKISLI